MFSSDSFVQIVFANTNDTYYTDGLLKLDLNRYLWLELHEKYDVVYFLSYRDELIYADTLGDYGSSPYEYVQKGLKLFSGSKQKRFLTWMKERLSYKNARYAFVCEASEMCDILENELWNSVLRSAASAEKKTGTLVFVVPPVVARSRRYLMYSNVFGVFPDNIIMGYRSNNNIKDFYSVLKKDKGESCVYLSAFTKERVRAMLQYMMFADMPERYLTSDETDAAAEYIVQYLTNVRLQWNERLFEKSFNLVNPLYDEVYDQLKKENVWSRLMAALERIEEAGGVRRYVKSVVGEYTEEESCSTSISYEKGTFPWKCMSLTPLPEDNGKEGFSLNVSDTLTEIRRELSKPRSCFENPVVAKSADALLLRLNNALAMGDSDTYKRALYSIQFCVHCLYAPKESNSDIEGTIAVLNKYITLSEEVHIASKNIGVAYGDVSAHMDSYFAKISAERKVKEMLLKKYDSVIPVSITSSLRFNYISTSELQDSVAKLFDDIDKRINEVEPEPEIPSRQTAPKTRQKPAAQKPQPQKKQEEEDEEEEYIIDDALSSFLPPTV